MYRRQFLQTLNAMSVGIIFPTSVFDDEGAPVVPPTAPQVLISHTGAIEATANGWTHPKVGIVAIGRAGSAILNDLTRRLPNLNRSVTISAESTSLKRIQADHRQIPVRDGTLPLAAIATLRLAEASTPEIADAVAGLDLVVIVVGMGTATDSAMAALVARILRQQGILSLAVATLSSHFESQLRMQDAQSGIRDLRVFVDGLLAFDHPITEKVVGKSSPFGSESSQAAFALTQLWRGILNPICTPTGVNIDFEDLRHNLLSHAGDCAFGFGSASGVDGAEAAALQAVEHPGLDRNRLSRASAILITVRAPPKFFLQRESLIALRSIRKQLSQDAWTIYGAYEDDTLGDEISVSVLASGIRDA